MGLFDECLAVEAINNQIKDNDQQEDMSMFRGKYCTLMFALEPVHPEEIENVKSDYSETNFNNQNQENWISAYQLPAQ